MKEFKKIIYNLTVISIIALIFVFGLQMRPKARLESEDEIIARLQKENEDNPESTNYLITDEYISNVLPETTVENLKKNIKEVVKVYENEGKESEIKTGKVKTGMVIEYVDNLRTYGLSVLGDIDRDGSLNQIELTREIRDIEKTEGWNISEKIDIYSGDMNRNGKIDKDDVESIIEYIVYGKLETNKFATILKPEIKVTSGNFKVDRYDSNVEIEITQKDENGQRTVYKVTDSNESEDGQYIEIENRESIKIEKDGIYKITAYTYGAEGNKSKGETVIIVREKPTYTVKYSAGEHGKFETQITNKLYIGDDTPEFEGEIEGNEGYKFVGWSEEIDKTVKGNKEYIAMWEPIEYTIEYDLDGGKIAGINPTKYTIESTNITLNNPTKEGYKFLGWKEEKEEKINEIVTIEKGSTGNRKYTAKWKGVTGVPYKVKTYIMDTTGKYKETVVEYRGETDEIINVDTTAEEGFTYEDKLSKPSGKIKADGSTELEIYFSRNQYTIKVIAGKGIGEVKVNKENGKIVEKKIYYEAEVAIEAKVEKGYTWEKYISNNKRVENLEEQELKIKMPIGDIELTAVGEINEYKIEYDLEGGNLKAGESNPSKYTVETEKIILVNPNKYGYNFIGWTGSNGTEAEEVVAIEKGSIGNRAYKANWEGAEGTEYTVKTYIMNVDGEYEETVEKRTGKTDEVIELNPKAEKGFTYEENISIPRGKVLVDGSTVLKLYFSRNKYSVKLESEDGIEKVEGAKEYYYGSEVIINAKAKDGYVWNSWENDGQEVSKDQNYTFSMPAENVELIAKADAIEYTINYELNGGEVKTENPVNYTVETESFTLNNPEKTGYTFVGWTGSNGETAEKEVTIEKGSIGNKEYIANWEANADTPYKISIYKMNVEGIYEKTTTDYKGTTGEKVVAEVETENGFTYEEELSTKEGIINGDGTTELEIYFSRNKYSVELIAGKGIEKVEGEKEYYYEAEVIINAKVKDGYEWNSWENDGQEVSKDQNYTFSMPAENVELIAKADAIEYTINYELNGGEVKTENPVNYTVETESFTLNNPEKTGYTFVGWTGSNGETAEKEVTIEKGSIGNKEYIANWEANADTPYKISIYKMNVEGIYEKTTTDYKGTTGEKVVAEVETENGFTYEEELSTKEGIINGDGTTELEIYFSRNKYSVELIAGKGIEKVEGEKEYYYEAEVIINAKVKDGYEWNSWENDGQEVSKDQNYTFSMPAENVELIAKADAIEYTINYELNGGVVRTENPESYTIETESFTLNNPEKTGYTFVGWIGSNGETAEKEVTIEKESTGNKEYIANWEINTYLISYELNGGEVRTENPVNYTVETENFTLNNPEKLGYTFVGWTGSNGETAEKEVTIEKGSTGNKEYIANWKINTYLISYELNGGEVRTENPVNYTVETESFTLNNPEKTGYTFVGWTGSNGETAEKEVTIEKGSTGNKEYIANWKVGEYTITYDPTEGTVNPTSTVANYNEPITMPTPERNYTVSYNTNGGSNVEEAIVIYGFEGWYTEKVLGEKKEYTLMPAYNETLYAHWKENSIVLGETSKKGYTFEGWYIDEELTEKVGNIGDTYTPNENITLYANWTINSYTITVHHKEDERETKIAEDETFKGNYNEEYNITDLLTNNGANERTELNADKYYYVRTEGKSEGNYEEDIEITFYYGVNTFNISGIAEEGGSISNISEEIRYGENSNKEIIITPEKGKRVANITINGIEIEFEEDENSKVVNLSKFENVIEDKEIVVTFEDIIMVVRIVSSPNEELVGTEYDSLKKALNILNDMGLNEESGETTIKIISTIEDESNVVENQNVIIDLAGNTVTSLQNTATISVKRAKLKIIDSANDGGKITNTQTVGIEVQEEGTLTLGEDDGNVWQTTPTIEGVNYGVNNKGRFNYYDGVIVGKIAINGTVQDLPYLKNPGITNEEGKQVATLATILDAEATIGKKTFTQLELAIEYANEKIGQDGSQVEIVIVKDLTKENEVTIDSSKNIKLNLNGYTTTFNANLVNNGKVEIIDELVTELGTERNGVMSFPANKLLNNENAIITLKNGTITGSIGGTDKTFESLVINNGRIVVDGGTITSDGKYSYTIKNEKNGGITLNEGNIASAANSNHSIYNIGNVTVNGGTITSSNSTGIYNVEEGNITMNAGTITAYCGIYNTSKGNVTITGGNINASYGIDNRNTGKVEVSNAVIKVTNAYYGIYNYSNGEINLENVNISSNYYRACGVYNRIDGKITVTESKIDIAIGGNYTSTAIYNYGVGTILLNNSIIKAWYGVENNSSGTITIENSTVENSDYGISNSRGTVTVTETTINAYKCGIDNDNGGKIVTADVDIIQTSATYDYYSGITNSGNILVKSGKIDAISYGIRNNGAITIANGAVINSTYYDGIYNYNTGIVTIEDAKISTIASNYRGIYNVDKGTINIGNAENEINNESPKITSANIGIDNLYGTLNFYDGTITALNDKVLIGKVTNMPENAELLITPNEDETETAILGNDEAVVKIGETSYNSLEKAIESSKDGDIIVYQKNATISNKVLVNSTKNIILDLAGNTIRMYNQIENQGNLKITDSSKTEETKGTGTLKTYGISGIINSESGNLTIEKATILNNISGTSNSKYACLIQNYGEIKIVDATLNTTGKYNFAINNNNTGNLTMEGGTITSSGENSDGIWNYGTLLIKSGTITACDRAIFNRESGNLTIEGATINATGKNGIGINQSSTEPIVITDGNINSKYYGIYNNTTGKIEILGGVITANYGIYNKSTGEVKVDGTQITSNPESSDDRYGIYNYSTGIITLKDVNITLSSNSYSCGIYNNSTGNITIDSISLTVTNTASYRNCIGIYNKVGEIVLKSGTIDVLHKDTSNNTNYHAYGIYNDSTGTVTIGEMGGEVSTSLPRITATGTTNSYGIYNTKGILNFYDGIVTGTEGYAIYNLISAQEEGYEVIKEINGDGTESATLQKLAIAQIVSTGEKYYNLQDAVDKVGDNKETVQILRDATLSSTTETVVINENKNIVIDLNGKIVEVGNINTIQNNGTLEIVDSSKTEDIEGTGMLINTATGTNEEYKTLITNNGEMKLTEGTLKITGDYGRVILNNAGATLEVNGGKIISSVNKQCFSIYNLGTTNVNGGKINSEVNLGNANDCSYGISTEGEGFLTITAGEITVSSSGGYYGGIYRYSTISKAININSTGATKIMGGTINVTNGSYIYAVINNNTGELTIKDTNIITQTRITNGYGVYNASTGNISMENTTIEANYGIYNNNIGNIEILDSIVTASYGIYNNSAGEIEILGGEITAAEYGIYNRNTGKVKAERNQITSKSGSSGSRYGIYNYSTGMIALKDMNITLSNYSVYGIYNNSSGNIIIDNISLIVTNNSNSYCTGIYNKAGEIVLKSGTIDVAHKDTGNNTNYHAYGIYNDGTGTVTIGEIGGEVSTSLPKITATGTTNSYGIYNTKGILNFYDGIVTGTEGYAIYNLISDQEEGYEVIKEINEDGTESATLQKLEIAQIVSTGKKYYHLQDAIDEIGDNKETVQILRNASLSATTEKLVINENKNVVIDLNGKIVEVGNINTIQNDGTLEIIDSSKTEENEVKGAFINVASGTKDEYKTLITNNGEMKLTEGTLKITGDYGRVILNNAGATLEVNGGKIISSVNKQCFSIYNLGTTNVNGGKINSEVNLGNADDFSCGITTEGEGTLTITAGEITVSSISASIYSSTISKAININSTGATKIIGGTINVTKGSYSYAIINNNTGELTIKNTNIVTQATKSYCYGVYNTNIGNISMENTTIEANYGIYNNNIGTIEILDGVITGSYGIYNNSTGKIAVKGGVVTSNYYGIYNNRSGTISIEDANITVTSTSNDAYGIENYETGEIVLKSGIVQATYSGTGSYKAYGIHNRSTGIITIGIKDKNVKNDILTVQGATNGLYINNSNANINFYDGTIIGNIKAIYGEIDEVEEGYELNITENETKATLKVKDATVESVASVGNIYYDTIQEAINAIESEGTIQIHKEIEQNTQIVIETGKNITIDMQAHGIVYDKAEPVIVIENGATLSIIDTYEDGTDETIYGQIQNTAGVAIKNQGILYIGIDDSEVYRNSPRIEGTKAIENMGELHIYDGTITGGITGTGTTEDKR